LDNQALSSAMEALVKFADADDRAIISVVDRQDQALYVSESALGLRGLTSWDDQPQELNAHWQYTRECINEWNARTRTQGFCLGSVWYIAYDYSIHKFQFAKHADQQGQVLSIYARHDDLLLAHIKSYEPDKKHFVMHSGETIYPKELVTFLMYLQGQSNSQIADRVHLSRKGIDARLSSIAKKFGKRPRELREFILRDSDITGDIAKLMKLVGEEDSSLIP
jgi:hypothetical protein